MNRFASELITQKVILRQESAVVGMVRNVVINPENGQFLGFVIKEGFGKQKLKALAEKDILGFNDKFILISGYSNLGEIEEIVRIKNVLDKKIPIVKNKVYTQSGTYLGKVKDFSVNFETARLSRLYINARSIRKLVAELVIDEKSLISIKKDRITVEDSSIKEKEKKSIPLKSTEKKLA